MMLARTTYSLGSIVANLAKLPFFPSALTKGYTRQHALHIYAATGNALT